MKVRRFTGGLLLVAALLPVASATSSVAVPRVVASISLSGSPQAIAVGDAAVWVTTLRSVMRVDPRANRITRRLRLVPIVGAVAIGGPRVWLARTPIQTSPGGGASSQLWSVDPGTGRLRRSPTHIQRIQDIHATPNGLWATNGDHAQYGRLFHVDSGTGKVVAALKIPGAPEGLVEEHGLLWVACSDTGLLYRVNPKTDALVGKSVRGGTALLTIAAGHDRVWVGDSYAGAVNSISANTGKLLTHTKLLHVSDVAVGDGAVWVTVDKPSELVRLDPTSGQEVGRPLPIEGTASGLAIGFGSIWVITDKAVIRVQP